MLEHLLFRSLGFTFLFLSSVLEPDFDLVLRYVRKLRKFSFSFTIDVFVDSEEGL